MGYKHGIFEVARGFVFAQHDERNGNFIASMTPRARRLTGCSEVSARTAEGLAASGNVRVYKSKATPARLLREALAERAADRAPLSPEALADIAREREEADERDALACERDARIDAFLAARGLRRASFSEAGALTATYLDPLPDLESLEILVIGIDEPAEGEGEEASP